MPNSTKTPTMIDHRQLTPDNTFRHRSGPDSASHLSALRKTLRNTGRLDAVLVWLEIDKDDKPTGRLILIDGHYRVAAYRAEQHAGKIDGNGIPAVLLKCDRLEAHLEALKANSKDTLPLSAIERANAAWYLVRTFGYSITKARLSKVSGVAERTIANMRKQLRVFAEQKAMPTGNWTADRRFPDETTFTPATDAERKKMVDDLSTALRAALNEVRTRDTDIIAEALDELPPEIRTLT